jgi:hypothetical protein
MLHLLFQVSVSTECACVPQTESPHRSPRRHQSDESSKHDWCNDWARTTIPVLLIWGGEPRLSSSR